MGRPAKNIDPETVRKLAKLGATQQEVAEWFGCARSVISERFGEDFQLGRAASKISLRRLQWKAAMGGSVPMLIHLGKVYLGQSDRVDLTSEGKGFGQPHVVLLPVKDLHPDNELDGWAEQRVRAKADRLERENRLAALTLEDPGSDPAGLPPSGE